MKKKDFYSLENILIGLFFLAFFSTSCFTWNAPFFSEKMYITLDLRFLMVKISQKIKFRLSNPSISTLIENNIETCIEWWKKIKKNTMCIWMVVYHLHMVDLYLHLFFLLYNKQQEFFRRKSFSLELTLITMNTKHLLLIVIFFCFIFIIPHHHVDHYLW